MSDTTDLDRPVTPGARARARDLTGTPLEIDGQTWVLADGRLARDLDELRDRLYDESVTRGSVDVRPVRAAAWVLLSAHYDLTPDETAALLFQADPQALADAVLENLFGAARRWNYSDWARSALLANGLDPATVPLADVDAVLRQLVLCGRAAPQEEFISAAAHAARRAKLSGLAR